MRDPVDGCGPTVRCAGVVACRAHVARGVAWTARYVVWLVTCLVATASAVRAEPGTWSGGVIYDPTSGRTYDAMMTLVDPDRLDVRGYFGFRLLGRTVTWRRVGSLGPCTR